MRHYCSGVESFQLRWNTSFGSALMPIAITPRARVFLYRFLPFWLASLINRILVVFVPMVVVLIPGLRLIPALYKWRIKLGIYRWYRTLLALEKELVAPNALQRQDEFVNRLNQIEVAVNKMKVPASFAEQFYVLRGHIDFVRGRLQNSSPSSS